MTPGGAKVTVLVWLKDEEHILPFFLRHYAFADEIVAFDNESTDRSREILSANPRVRIVDWNTDGLLRDDQLQEMKSNEYRKLGEGWFIMVDADEFVYHPQILWLLNMYDKVGVTLPSTMGFDMVSQDVPADDGRSLLTDLVKEGMPNHVEYSKYCVVRHNCFINYTVGAHWIKQTTGRVMVSEKRDIYVLHYRYLSSVLVVEKARRIRLSQQNMDMQIGIKQADPELMKECWKKVWNQRVRVLS